MLASDVASTFRDAERLGTIGATAIVRNEAIGIPTDVDMYKFTVNAGQQLGFDVDTPLNGPPGLGSFLRVFDSSSRELAANNDLLAPGDPPPGPNAGSQGFDSYIAYTFTKAGDYYVGVSNWQHRLYDPVTGTTALGSDPHWLTGSYSLTVSDTAPKQELQISTPKWSGLTPSGKAPAAVILFSLKATGSSGVASLRLYQSNDKTLQKGIDPVLAEQTISFLGNASQVCTVLLSSPPRSGTRPAYVIIEIDPGGNLKDTNRANNVAALKVAEPSPLSFELESTAPLANRRIERVELWLRSNRATILSEARYRNVSAEAIAGIIAWESLMNVKPSAAPPSYGVGKVHAFELTGESLAVSVERLGYVPNLYLPERITKLRTISGSIEYIGAILDAFSDFSEAAGSKADLRKNAPVLATLYQGVKYKGENVRLNNAAKYFHDKVVRGDRYSPNLYMGRWVEANLNFLKRALS